MYVDAHGTNRSGRGNETIVGSAYGECATVAALGVGVGCSDGDEVDEDGGD